jgi:hypothetical protein
MGMENPFLLAVALWESREVTIRLLAGARENEPDSPVGGEKPIDWRLLAYDRVRTEVAEGNGFDPTVAGRSSDRENGSHAPSLRQAARKNPRTACPT